MVLNEVKFKPDTNEPQKIDERSAPLVQELASIPAAELETSAPHETVIAPMEIEQRIEHLEG